MYCEITSNLAAWQTGPPKTSTRHQLCPCIKLLNRQTKAKIESTLKRIAGIRKSPSHTGSYDSLIVRLVAILFGQLRPIGNVLVYSLRLVVDHMLICMIIYVFIPSGQL